MLSDICDRSDTEPYSDDCREAYSTYAENPNITDNLQCSVTNLDLTLGSSCEIEREWHNVCVLCQSFQETIRNIASFTPDQMHFSIYLTSIDSETVR